MFLTAHAFNSILPLHSKTVSYVWKIKKELISWDINVMNKGMEQHESKTLNGLFSHMLFYNFKYLYVVNMLSAIITN